MDHFLSGLEHNGSWYATTAAPRATATLHATPGHEFAVGASKLLFVFFFKLYICLVPSELINDMKKDYFVKWKLA